MGNPQPHETGSMLVMTSFILLTIALLITSYWRLIGFHTASLTAKEGGVKAYFLARGGLEDVAYELKSGNDWGGEAMAARWEHASGETYYKSTSSAKAPLTFMSYPATMSVTVSGNPSINTLNVVSRAQVGSGDLVFTEELRAQMIKTISSEIIILGVE